jgi:ubiquitin-protein ligase E3 C
LRLVVAGATVQRLVTLALRVAEAELAPEAGSSVGRPPGPCTQHLVLVLLSAPHMTRQLSADTRALTLSAPLLPALLAAAQQLAAARQLSGPAACSCLGNLVQLLLCPEGTTPQDGSSSRAVYSLGASPSLAHAPTAAAYATAAMQLLAAAGGGAGNALLAQLWPLAGQAHLLQMLDVLPTSHEHGMWLFAAYCVGLLVDLPRLSEAASSSSERLASNAAASTSSPGAGDGSAAPAAASTAATAAAGPSALNTLAFAPRVLPALWRWLCVQLGLPLEAPLAASRGLVRAHAAWVLCCC